MNFIQVNFLWTDIHMFSKLFSKMSCHLKKKDGENVSAPHVHLFRSNAPEITSRGGSTNRYHGQQT